MPDALDEMTPIMGATDVEYAQQLSCNRLCPPLAIPGFEQKEFLGRGSFGEVWKAVDSNNGRVVAIKYFKRGGSIDWSHMAREVEKLRYLFSERRVVQLFDVGWDSEPPYYVMEYMERGSLEDLLRNGPLPVSESLRIIREVAVGLVHAHDKGVLHCDLKPANIMLDEDNQPRLADFGQARLRQELTPSLGTLFYMAPDQADLKAMPDARWDVYALGVILYRMLTGELPFRVGEAEGSKWSSGSIEERLTGYREHLLQAPKPTAHRHVAGVDKSLADIIDRCLNTNPKHRYHNVQAVLTALDQRAARLARRSLLIVGGIGPIAVTCILAVIAWGVFRTSIHTAEQELLQRTEESNAFAAESVAARLALEVDKRWRILEHEATSPELLRLLAEPKTDAASSAGSSENSGGNASAGAASEADADFEPVEATESAAERWIASRFRLWNNQFGATGKAAYWFVLDAQGQLRSISPMEEELIGQYFGYRDYFHGQGKELPKTAKPPPPITRPYRSAVFRSQPENVLAVAFSVPIWSQTEDQPSEVVGVLVMETILSHISDFRASRKQAAVLVDLRPDQTGKRGLIVDHPSFAIDEAAADSPARADSGADKAAEPELLEFYLDPSLLQRISQIRDGHLDSASQNADADTHSRASGSPDETPSERHPPVQPEPIVKDYDDPVTEALETDTFVAVEPVLVSRGDEPQVDTGWSILIQESRVDTLAPISTIWTIFARGGAIGLVLVVALLAGLWAFVIFVINRPDRFRRKGNVGSPPSGLSGSSAASSSASGSAALSEQAAS